MQVLHVNLAQPQTVFINGKDVSTGINKVEAEGPVQVGRLGLEGDGQADLTVHGGPHQAVYAYPIEHYAFWENELGIGPLESGAFGENLTLKGLIETDACIGDILGIGGLVLQITSARIPCFKLGNKLNRPDILKPFLQSGRSGFYFRVLQEAPVSAGGNIEILERDSRKVTVRELLGMHRLGEGSPESIRLALEIDALAPLVRKDLESRLEKMNA
jgi:MOSC domain-containing protein YiiM